MDFPTKANSDSSVYFGQPSFQDQGDWQLPKHVSSRERKEKNRERRNDEPLDTRDVHDAIEDVEQEEKERNANLRDRYRDGKGKKVREMQTEVRYKKDPAQWAIAEAARRGFKRGVDLHKIEALAWTSATEFKSYVLGWQEDVVHWLGMELLHYDPAQATKVVAEQISQGRVVNEGKTRCMMMPPCLDIGAITVGIADGGLLTEHGMYIMELLNIALQGWQFQSNPAIFAFMRDLKFSVNVGLSNHLFSHFATGEDQKSGSYYKDVTYVWRVWQAIRAASNDWERVVTVNVANDTISKLRNALQNTSAERIEYRKAITIELLDRMIKPRLGKSITEVNLDDMFFKREEHHRLPNIIVRERMTRMCREWGLEYGVKTVMREVMREYLDDDDNEVLVKVNVATGYKFEDLSVYTKWYNILKIRPLAKPGTVITVRNQKITVGKSFGLLSYVNDDAIKNIIFGVSDPNVQYHEHLIVDSYREYFRVNTKLYGFDYSPLFDGRGVNIKTGEAFDRNHFVRWPSKKGVHLFMNVDIYTEGQTVIITYVS